MQTEKKNIHGREGKKNKLVDGMRSGSSNGQGQVFWQVFKNTAEEAASETFEPPNQGMIQIDKNGYEKKTKIN